MVFRKQVCMEMDRNINISPKSSLGCIKWLCPQGVQMLNTAPSSSSPPNRCLNPCHHTMEPLRLPWAFPLAGSTLSPMSFVSLSGGSEGQQVLNIERNSVSWSSFCKPLLPGSYPHILPHWPPVTFMTVSPMAWCQDYPIFSVAFDPVGILDFWTSLCFSL